MLICNHNGKIELMIFDEFYVIWCMELLIVDLLCNPIGPSHSDQIPRPAEVFSIRFRTLGHSHDNNFIAIMWFPSIIESKTWSTLILFHSFSSYSLRVGVDPVPSIDSFNPFIMCRENESHHVKTCQTSSLVLHQQLCRLPSWLVIRLLEFLF